MTIEEIFKIFDDQLIGLSTFLREKREHFLIPA